MVSSSAGLRLASLAFCSAGRVGDSIALRIYAGVPAGTAYSDDATGVSAATAHPLAAPSAASAQTSASVRGIMVQCPLVYCRPDARLAIRSAGKDITSIVPVCAA